MEKKKDEAIKCAAKLMALTYAEYLANQKDADDTKRSVLQSLLYRGS